MMTMPHLFLGIQVCLIAAAGALLAGAFYGLLLRTQNLSSDIMSHWPNSNGINSRQKRRAARMKCNLFVELLEGERVAGIGRLLNISAAGACFASDAALETGDYIMARLPALRKGTNKISGHVVWSKTTPTTTLYGIRLNPTTPV